jgi:hypothetical protein
MLLQNFRRGIEFLRFPGPDREVKRIVKELRPVRVLGKIAQLFFRKHAFNRYLVIHFIPVLLHVEQRPRSKSKFILCIRGARDLASQIEWMHITAPQKNVGKDFEVPPKVILGFRASRGSQFRDAPQISMGCFRRVLHKQPVAKEGGFFGKRRRWIP